MDDRKRLKNIWYCMKRRCMKPAPSDYLNGIASYYFEKGIRVCDEWATSFESFYEWALKNGYSDGLTIDRINSDKGYSPDNCQWITLRENVMRANKNRTIKVSSNNCSVSKKGNYFIARHLLGTDFAIVLDTRLSYSEANRKNCEFTKKPGHIFPIIRHGKTYRLVKPRDVIDFPIKKEVKK